ncbi:hypothetical protein [Derxia gummosa]|uniref:Uncharacterized protein n=1 Tax=Derxia gummosa DSM 723 TaxID=1121388 RepID=A0A8B6XCL8_9BURK|nr:hypothetical protein [Derxia gummosa]
MATDLNELKKFLRPTTLEEILRVRSNNEQGGDNADFVHALAAEMIGDYVACAAAGFRKNPQVMQCEFNKVQSG